ncbi:MAG TPA: HepT-like ribonuclease domain-containing protein [Candidatus Obscuribacterales bacterium]
MKPEQVRKELLWLQDMREAVEKIETHPQFTGDRDVFERDEHYRVWVFYHIERLGECASQLRKQFDYDRRYPDIDWKGIVATRRHLVHWYWGIDNDKIWESITQDLPKLRDKLAELIQEKKREEKAVQADPEGDRPGRSFRQRLRESHSKKKDDTRGRGDDCLPGR